MVVSVVLLVLCMVTIAALAFLGGITAVLMVMQEEDADIYALWLMRREERKRK